jgi:Immunoglobulin-like domain of bacterial spore germination
MHTPRFVVGLLLFPLTLAACGSPVTGFQNPYPDDIQIDSPQPEATVSSPLVITGQARGGWYFEASFPVTLNDANGNTVAKGSAQAQGDWMTSEFVPFKATMIYEANTSDGTLILENANPSGMEENAKKVSMPVQF